MSGSTRQCSHRDFSSCLIDVIKLCPSLICILIDRVDELDCCISDLYKRRWWQCRFSFFFFAKWSHNSKRLCIALRIVRVCQPEVPLYLPVAPEMFRPTAVSHTAPFFFFFFLPASHFTSDIPAIRLRYGSSSCPLASGVQLIVEPDTITYTIALLRDNGGCKNICPNVCSIAEYHGCTFQMMLWASQVWMQFRLSFTVETEKYSPT